MTMIRSERVGRDRQHYSLSPLQQGMLFESLRDEGKGVYINQAVFRVEDLDVGAMTLAWQHVLRTNDALRASFVWEDLEQPVQVIHGEVEIPFAEYDWSDLDEFDQRHRLLSILKNTQVEGFDLSNPPLIRVIFAKITSHLWYHIFVHHHLIMDGWSKGIVSSQLQDYYYKAKLGRPIRIRKVGQFSKYIEYLDSLDENLAKTYWLDYLSGVNPRIRLPAEKKREYWDRGRGYNQIVDSVGGRDYQRILDGAKGLKATLNTILIGAWGVLLSQYSGERSVVFGSVVSGRPPTIPGVESIVGMFLNALPIRVDVNHATVVSDWIKAIHLSQSKAKEFEHTALRSIQEWCGFENGRPVYESIVVSRESGVREHGTGSPDRGKSEEPVPQTVQQNFPLYLDFGTRGNSLELRIIYLTGRFDSNLIRVVMAQIKRLIMSICTERDSPLEMVAMMDREEEQEIAGVWSKGPARAIKNSSILELVSRQASQNPAHVALRRNHDFLTFGALESLSERVAVWLQEQECVPGHRVLVGLDRSLEALVSILGILKAGCAYVPVDISAPKARLEFIAADCEAKGIITSDEYRSVFSGVDQRKTPVFLYPEMISADGFGGRRGSVISAEPQDLEVFSIIYTSGSTGNPKGVLLSHRTVLNKVLFQGFDINEDDVMVAKTSLAFVDSIWEYFAAWKAGVAVTILDKDVVIDSERFVNELSKLGATCMLLVPTVLKTVLEDCDGLSKRLSALRKWIVSGEPLTHRVRAMFHEKLPHAKLLNIYGATECWDACEWYTDAVASREVIQIGKPAPNVQVYVLNEFLALAPVGVVGDIYVGGDCVTQGYLNRQDLNDQAFRLVSIGSSDMRLLRTGDVGRWLSSGSIEHLGRGDRQVKVRGIRIELGEIEEQLRAVDCVMDAVVLDDESGSLIGFLRLSDESEWDRHGTIERIRSLLGIKLPESMIPSEFLQVTEIPKTVSGKIGYQALREHLRLYREGAGSEDTVVEDATPTELAVLEAWCEVLGKANLGLDDNVFENGAHSLAATRVAVRLSKSLGKRIPIKAVFENVTVRALAVWVDAFEEKSGRESDRVDVVSEGSVRELELSYSQRRLWFIDQVHPGGITYTLTNQIDFFEPVDPPAMELTLNELVRRHDGIRAVFENRNGVPAQIIQDPKPFPLYVEFFPDEMAPPRFEALVESRARALSGRPWNLEVGPLYRFELLNLGSRKGVLLIAMHHIITDGASGTILNQELGVLYRSFSHGKTPQLPAVRHHYADYIKWQQKWLKSVERDRQIHFWRQQLGDIEVFELPGDRVRPKINSGRGKTFRRALQEEAVRRLAKIAEREGASMFMTLLSVFYVFLTSASGSRDVRVGTPVANRNRPEFEEIVGFFVNTLVLRCKIDLNAPFVDLVRNTKRLFLDAAENQDLPFDVIVDELKPARELGRNPIFQIMYVHQVSKGDAGVGARPIRGKTVERETANFDILLQTVEREATVDFNLLLNTDLYSEELGDILVDRIGYLAEVLARHPDVPIGGLSRLPDRERSEILRMGKGPALDLRAVNILDWLRMHAEHQPDAIAAEDASTALSYRQLDERSTCLAAALHGAGVGNDEVVAIGLQRSPDVLIAMHAVWKVGGCVLMVDIHYPEERISKMLSRTQVGVVICEDATWNFWAARATEVKVLNVRKEWANPDGFSNLRHSPKPEDIALVIFTSGSTGEPKGVQVTHHNVVGIIEGQVEAFGISRDSRVLQSLSLSFDAAIGEIFRCVAAGGTLVFATRERVAAAEELLRVIRENNVSVAGFPPTVLSTLPKDEARRLPGLETLIVGGEVMPQELAEVWGGGRNIITSIGATETTIGTTCAKNWNLAEKPPLGRPLPNVQIYVLDERLDLVPIGAPGELCVGGVGVSAGYIGDEALTEQRFVTLPWLSPDQGRIYRTGDMVVWKADGELEFIGRADGQIKIRGHRVECEEVARAVQAHPEVGACVVKVQENEGVKRLIAYVTTTQPDAAIDPKVIRQFTKNILPEYMVPAFVKEIGSLPRTPNGKIDIKALPKIEIQEFIAGAEYVAPEDEFEATMVAIWEEVLGMQQIGVTTNFFEMGGDSILSIQVVSKANAAGYSISVKDFFESQTIRGLSEMLRLAHKLIH